MKGILVIQITRLGDILQSYPLLKDLQISYPEHQIHVLVNASFTEISEIMSDFNFIALDFSKLTLETKDNSVNYSVEYLNRLISELNSYNFDYIVNLNNSPIAKEIFNKLIAKKKAGFSVEEKRNSEWALFITSFLKNRTLNTVNLVDIFRYFLNVPVHKENLSTNKKIKAIAIQCGARNHKRQFEIRHYMEIINYYQQLNYQVYLLGIESEIPIAQKILTQLNDKSLVINMVNKTNITELFNLISKCERLYTPDTGTMHISAYCSTPFTAFFCGPAYPYETLGYSSLASFIMPNPNIFKCYPCKDDDKCPYNHECHNFSFTNFLNGDKQTDFIYGNAYYDSIGQNLRIQDCHFDNYYSALWRAFIKKYFFNLDEKFSSYPNESINNDIIREIKLWDMINDKPDLISLSDNFNLLAPLVYYKKMLPDSSLAKATIDFFRQYHKG